MAKIIARESSGKNVRLDIQGLRAFAVIAVVLDHMVGWPSGGFVGVDIFFVISGFLITGLLLREHDKTGTISFPSFYKRRIKRILPAATLVIVVTVAVSSYLFTSARATATLWDGVWATFFAANWNMAAQGTDYFQMAGPISPLQHYWSLSVEEQFYFVWPWIMLLIFFLGGRRAQWDKRAAHRAVGIAMIIIVTASFAWAVIETSTNPTVAYFSTLSRTWELGVGALLAVFAGVAAKMPGRARTPLAWLGLLGIVASVFLISTEAAFPAPWAALPVLATALVILAGTGGEARYLFLLTNRVSGYIGDISYSLYLWHFPVIILLAAIMPGKTPEYFIAAVALMTFTSTCSYHLLEDPIRRSRWLNGKGQEDKLARSRRRADELKRLSTPALVFLTILTVSCAGLALYNSRPVPVSAAAVPVAPVASPGATAAAGPATLQTALTAKINASLAVSEWPDNLTPSLDALDDKAWAPETWRDNCLSVTEKNWGTCTYGSEDAAKTAIVLGDSMAASWMPAIRGALEPQGYRIEMYTLSGCPTFVVTLTKESAQQCNDHRAKTIQMVNDRKPDLLITANLDAIGRIAGAPSGPATQTTYDIWTNAGVEFFKQVSTLDRVIMIGVPPRGPNLNECVTAVNKPQDCTEKIPGFWENVTAAEQKAVGTASRTQKNIDYIVTRDWFCTAQGCPPFIGNNPVRVDGIHPVGAYVETLGPIMAEAIKASEAPAG
ncbi:Peptidoglycan/LPS O-acetylase OafA/YrhL, contains acyltransferase and SGNH-hydrolase domains [Pseudarthrobacter enclensis]|uniref:Acyltransferase n=1 Tax=Pseudarthrobacter enclensis TaxID=993070 RepID=A0A0V8IVJ2_9MICC|nr:acyltransferase family protein [Pseudarthrobacter enclensis]KSU78696.1 hypothetical protein AS031_01195 [Pseudarthrobacter enclensis]SCB75571.1 Peptidoglycan/LPS O-acetylase OafA/YrhL, contains acyltransferase and SGNH-hydrolase domains [Pseudarthrobacter enclensis]